ncbi:ZIP family metal transporter [Vicingaceae bacterium]|nr:ZIP family metal transporter [Vicingaceae bacterium]
MSTSAIILLFLSSAISGLVMVCLKPGGTKNIKLLLSFSGSFLMAICFLHLLPEVFATSATHVPLFLLVGFFLQLILDYFSGGIEHGHIHLHKDQLKKFPYLVFLSLCFHAFVEAAPAFHIHGHGHEHEVSPLLIGIVLHKIPISIVLASLLLINQIKKATVAFAIILFSLMAPLGGYLGHWLSHTEELANLFPYLLALAAGILLHIATTILLETSENHKFSNMKIISILVGAILAIITTY